MVLEWGDFFFFLDGQIKGYVEEIVTLKLIN